MAQYTNSIFQCVHGFKGVKKEKTNKQHHHHHHHRIQPPAHLIAQQPSRPLFFICFVVAPSSSRVAKSRLRRYVRRLFYIGFVSERVAVPSSCLDTCVRTRAWLVRRSWMDSFACGARCVGRCIAGVGSHPSPSAILGPERPHPRPHDACSQTQVARCTTQCTIRQLASP